MILTPRHDLRDHSIDLKAQQCIRGSYRLRKGINDGYYDVDSGLWLPGKDIVTAELGWFPNIITNYGMNRFGNGVKMQDACLYIHVGEGTTAAAVGDTALETWVASVGTAHPNGDGGALSPPDYVSAIRRRRFGEGVAEGTLSEIGCASGASNTNMFTRALIVDGGGSPTTFPVTATEWLDAEYEYRLYADYAGADGTGVATFSGVDYNYVIRPSRMNNNWNAWDSRGGGYMFASVIAVYCGGTGAALASRTSFPSGGGYASSDGSYVNGSYTTDSFTRNSTLTLGLAEGNRTGGIVVMEFNTGQGCYQMSFDKVSGGGGLTKDGTKELTFSFTVTWARASI